MSRERGFTYLEMMIAVSILGLVIVAVGQLLDVGLLDWNKGETRLEAGQNLRIAMDRMSRDLRLARGVGNSSTPAYLEIFLPGNVKVQYSLDTFLKKGPGGISGYTMVRTYTKYTDGSYLTPEAGYPKVYDLAEYLSDVQFTYFKLTGGSLAQADPGQSDLVKVKLSSAAGVGAAPQLSSGIALRGKDLPRG